jgi:selenocysteine-specific translation elongation factor
MSARVVVERVFQVPHRGPVAMGLLMAGTVSVGDRMLALDSGATVAIRGLEFHVPQPGTGQRVGLLLRMEDATAVAAGSTLVSAPPPAPDRELPPG